MILIVYMFIRMILADNSMANMAKELNASSLYYSEWICVKEDKGIALHERWVKVNDSLNVRERRGVFVVDCYLEEVIIFLKDYKTIDTWMKGVKQVRLLSEDDDNLIYLIIGLPWPFTKRDLVARYSVLKQGDSTCVVQVQSESGGLKETEKMIRINNYRATWTLTRFDSNKTKVEFNVFSNEPPVFPRWMQDPVIKKVFFNNLMRLKCQLNNEKS